MGVGTERVTARGWGKRYFNNFDLPIPTKIELGKPCEANSRYFQRTIQRIEQPINAENDMDNEDEQDEK